MPAAMTVNRPRLICRTEGPMSAPSSGRARTAIGVVIEFHLGIRRGAAAHFDTFRVYSASPVRSGGMCQPPPRWFRRLRTAGYRGVTSVHLLATPIGLPPLIGRVPSIAKVAVRRHGRRRPATSQLFG